MSCLCLALTLIAIILASVSLLQPHNAREIESLMDNGIETHHNEGACADQRVGRRASAPPAMLVGGTASALHDDAVPGRQRFMTMRRVLRKPLHEMDLEPVDEAANDAAALEHLGADRVNIVISERRDADD